MPGFNVSLDLPMTETHSFPLETQVRIWTEYLLGNMTYQVSRGQRHPIRRQHSQAFAQLPMPGTEFAWDAMNL